MGKDFSQEIIKNIKNDSLKVKLYKGSFVWSQSIEEYKLEYRKKRINSYTVFLNCAQLNFEAVNTSLSA